MRCTQYDCFPVDLAPGASETIRVRASLFKLEKIILFGRMSAIRGHYCVKRPRLPPLDRDDVTGFSRVHRWCNGREAGFRPGKTTITYSGPGKAFTREYQPVSVAYVPVDPLGYVRLLQVTCDDEPQLLTGVPGQFFDAGVLGNGFPFATARASVALCLKNVGDVPVRVDAILHGTTYCEG